MIIPCTKEKIIIPTTIINMTGNITFINSNISNTLLVSPDFFCFDNFKFTHLCILSVYQPYTPNTRISSYKILISLLLSDTPFYTQKQACQYLCISKLFSSYLCSFLLRLSISDKQKIISFSYIISTIFFSSG